MTVAPEGDATVPQIYRFGPRWLDRGLVEFRLWAPAQSVVKIVLARESLTMAQAGDGWHSLVIPASAGTRYAFELEDGSIVPDPASRHQPDDVHGASELVADAKSAVDWRGRAWEEMVLYELHVGTFTREGTFAAAQGKLDHLATLGITGIELKPIADFPGTRGWGYDGVLLYAPESSYGRPEDLRAFVAAAHERGIAVLLDVVYNHFGPEGNYIAKGAPQFFTEHHHTPWGAGFNFDSADSRPVRDFFVENALYWLREFDIDGLRLDAVHAIADNSSEHVLKEIARRVHAEFKDRPIHLILENDENEARPLARLPGGKPLEFTAQWNDDLHHALHAAATGEGSGYYSEYLDDTDLLARALAEGFAFQGEVMRYRGRKRGQPSTALPPSAFVSFLQNHDQIGNRALGERLGAIAPLYKYRAVASIVLLAPQIPMFFMGEEWGAREPFFYFCDLAEPLASAVRDGRRAEFARFPEYSDPARRDRIPDPLALDTFQRSKLNWDDLALPEQAEWFEWTQRVLRVRLAEVIPVIPKIRRAATWEVIAPGAFYVKWDCGMPGCLRLRANLSSSTVEFPRDVNRVIWTEGGAWDATAMIPWTVRWLSGAE